MPGTSGSDTGKKSNTGGTLDPRLSGRMRKMSCGRATSPPGFASVARQPFPGASEVNTD